MQQKSYRIVRDCFPNENRRPFCDICIDLLDSKGMTTTCPKAVTEIKSVFRPLSRHLFVCENQLQGLIVEEIIKTPGYLLRNKLLPNKI
jgi:hypothetical protein